MKLASSARPLPRPLRGSAAQRSGSLRSIPGVISTRRTSAVHFVKDAAADRVDSFGTAAGTQTVLIIGGTGVTGQNVMSGLQGLSDSKLRLLAMTRNTSSSAAVALRAQSIDTIQGDLDDPQSLAAALQGVDFIYCHALSSDAKKADPAEVQRALRLAAALKGSGVQLVAYNSSAGYGSGYEISHMDQKHKVEDILSGSGVPLTALRATMFMEEFWNRYTRPGIVDKGVFTFAMSPDKKLQLLAARDMGVVAGKVLQSPNEWKHQAMDLAGDELTPREMAATFTRHQTPGGPVPVSLSSPPELFTSLFGLDLWRLTRFLNEKGYSADIPALRKRFPELMTFDQFLSATHWDDAARTYEGGITYDPARMTHTASPLRPEEGDPEYAFYEADEYRRVVIELHDTVRTKVEAALGPLSLHPTIFAPDAVLREQSLDGNTHLKMVTFSSPPAIRHAYQSVILSPFLTYTKTGVRALTAQGTPHLDIEIGGTGKTMIIMLLAPARLCTLRHKSYTTKYYLTVPTSAPPGTISIAALYNRMLDRKTSADPSKPLYKPFDSRQLWTRMFAGSGMLFCFDPTDSEACAAAKEDMCMFLDLWCAWAKEDWAEGQGAPLPESLREECAALTTVLDNHLDLDEDYDKMAKFLSADTSHRWKKTVNGEAALSNN